ncbi:MAG: hypothetical protein LQ349_004374 [Xanthoria aureola]|nr:MAG: hypothetical protein LQ349_004374 [Xanthoria aureola]
MCIDRRFDYPCGHYYGSLLDYCTGFKRLPEWEQDERKIEKPHRCPKGAVEVERVTLSGKEEDVRAAVDQATKCINRHLERVRVGKFNLGPLKIPSAGGCQLCHEASEAMFMVLGPKWDKLLRLRDIRNNEQAAFLTGSGAPPREEQRESAQRLADHIGGKTELGTHLAYEPFGITLPMLLLSRPAAQKSRGNDVEGPTESGEGSAGGGAD